MPSSVLDEVSAVRWEPVLSAQPRSWGVREKTRSQDSGLPGGTHLSGALVYLLFGSAQKIKGSSALPSLSTIIF